MHVDIEFGFDITNKLKKHSKLGVLFEKIKCLFF